MYLCKDDKSLEEKIVSVWLPTPYLLGFSLQSHQKRKISLCRKKHNAFKLEQSLVNRKIAKKVYEHPACVCRVSQSLQVLTFLINKQKFHCT